MSLPWLWAAFGALVLGMLAADLAFPAPRARPRPMRASALWSAAWVCAAAGFGTAVALRKGPGAGVEFATGYVVEQALSVDNLFVFLLIFTVFRVPAELQRRVLLWGIVGALALRGAVIAAGVVLIAKFAWITYVFGAFLVATGARLAVKGDDAPFDPARSPVLRGVRRCVPVTRDFVGARLFVRERLPDGSVRRAATPLLVVLVLVEAMDLVFAVDSIPAVFGVTRDPFIVYTSNAFAVLGLRSLYGLLAGALARLRFLNVGLAVVLALLGAKMLAAGVWEVPTFASLGVVIGVLAVATLASLAFPAPARAAKTDVGPSA